MKRVSLPPMQPRSFRQRPLSSAVRQVLLTGGMTLVFGLHSPGWVLAQGFPATIELSDLDGTDGFVLNGIDTGNISGRSVSGVGDINGDGVDDLLIGARNNYSSSNSAGYVVFGGTGVGIAGELELSDLDGADGFALNGLDVFDSLPGTFSSAGDINGDGADDLLIGAPMADPGFLDEGRSYVVFGGSGVGSSGALDLTGLDGTDGFVLNGIDILDRSGSSVSSAGDFNGDGMDDLLIGAYRAYPNGNGFAGESYVVFGGNGVGSTGVLALSDLDGTDGFVLNGIDSADNSGSSVSSAGDVNGDGVGDLLIGALRADPNGNDAAGESYVVFGGSGVGSTGVFELSDLDGTDGFVLNGIDPGDFSGFSVSSAGDVNGDGVGDLVIGAERADPNGNINAGESYVVFGGSGVGSTGVLELSDLDGANGFVLNGDSNDRSGRSVSSAGDVNGDGVDDLLIGAPFAAPNGGNSGKSYVVFGGIGVGSTGVMELSDLDGADGFVLNGIDSSDFSGNSVSSAGDVNGDGLDDLLIGAPFADPNGNSSAGESYVVFGQQPIVELMCNGQLVTVDLSNSEVPTIGDDVILGTSGPDTINALAGNDTICGEGGDDLIIGNLGDDWIDGGAGDDEIRGNGGEDDLYGDEGDDTIRGGGGNDEIFGEAGDDTLLGQSGEDIIDGGDGIDDINGGGGNDTLSAGGGATVGTGKLVFGGSGVDTITGGPDADDLRGGNGNDIINGFGGDDFITGGENRDTIDGGDGDDMIIGNNAIDTLSGGAGNDVIEGGGQSDILNGGDGDDELIGGSGNDELNGDSGSDMLFGGAGDDDLDGGASEGDECSGQLGIDTATAACEVVNTVP